MQTGWLNQNGTYYFLQSNGQMAANTTLTIDNKSYSFNANGAYVENAVNYNTANTSYGPSGNGQETMVSSGSVVTATNPGGNMSNGNGPTVTSNAGMSSSSDNSTATSPMSTGTSVSGPNGNSSATSTVSGPSASNNNSAVTPGGSTVYTGSSSSPYDNFGNLIPGLTSGPGM